MVTREKLEQALIKVLGQSVPYSRHEEILNELFPPEFEVNEYDWIVKEWIDGDVDVIHLTKKVSKYYYAQDYYVRNEEEDLIKEAGNIDILEAIKDDRINLRHATPEEIAAAEWEEGKPYKVWIDEEWKLRVSSDKVGHFYTHGRFEGNDYEWEKYEKL